MSYAINNIPLSDFGIIAGQHNNSNIALSGWLDMPKRIGKTYHDWGDSHGVEPYVSADEIFFGGRDLVFKGFVKSESKYDLVTNLNDLKNKTNEFDELFEFATPYGTFNVHVKDEIKVSHLVDGYATIVIKFREPVVTIPNVAIPTIETNYNKYGVDGIYFEAISAFLVSVKDNMNRAKAKSTNSVSIHTQKLFSYAKTTLHSIKVELFFKASSIEVLTENIGIFHQQLASEGLRQLNVDDTGNRAFCIDGFKVSEIQKHSNISTAKLNVGLILNNQEIFKDTSLTNNAGGDILTNNDDTIIL